MTPTAAAPAAAKDGGEAGGETRMLVTHYEGRRLNSPNDCVVGPDGAIWFTDPTYGIQKPSQGCPAEPELDHRSVYRYDPESGALTRAADLEQPNGLAFAPDGRTLYVSDTSVEGGDDRQGSGRHEIVAFAGGRPGRRLFIWAVDLAG